MIKSVEKNRIAWKLRLLIFIRTVKSNKKYLPICASCTKAWFGIFVTVPKNVDNFLKGKEIQVEKSHKTGVIHENIHVIHILKPRLSNDKTRQGWKFVLLRTYKSQKREKNRIIRLTRVLSKKQNKKRQVVLRIREIRKSFWITKVFCWCSALAML